MHYCLLFWKKNRGCTQNCSYIVNVNKSTTRKFMLAVTNSTKSHVSVEEKKRPLKVILKSHLICNFSLYPYLFSSFQNSHKKVHGVWKSRKKSHLILRAKRAITFIFWVDMHRNFCRIRSIFTFHWDLRWENTIHLRSYLLFYHQVHNIRNKNADPRIQLHNMKMKKKEVKRDEELILFKLAKKYESTTHFTYLKTLLPKS